MAKVHTIVIETPGTKGDEGGRGDPGPPGPSEAALISFEPAGDILSTNVQDAIEEVAGDTALVDAAIQAHEAGTNVHSVGAITGLDAEISGIVDAAVDAHEAGTNVHSVDAITGLSEQIRDIIGAALVAGTNVTVTVNDPGDTITISAAAAAVGVQPGTPSGSTQSFSIPGSTIASTNTSMIPGANRIFYTPFRVEKTITVDRLACEITTAQAGQNVRLGLYAAGLDGQPTGAPLADTGNISTAAVGAQVRTVSASLAPGRYMTALACSGATAGVRSATITGYPTMISAAAFGTGTNIVIYSRRAVFTYAALPNTGPPWTLFSTLTAPSPEPLVLMRWSTT